jgi:hypothetical protein
LFEPVFVFEPVFPERSLQLAYFDIFAGSLVEKPDRVIAGEHVLFDGQWQTRNDYFSFSGQYLKGDSR